MFVDDRFQFRSTNPGSYGNFLDNIVVSLAAYVEMGSDDANAESISSAPGMIVSGTVDVATDVSFSVTGGTATLGSDYTVSASTITVPPGVYPDVFFPLPVTIIDDAVFEPDETIEFTIGTPSSAELTIASGQCGPAPNLAATYTIFDNDPYLDIAKTVETFDPALASADIFSLPGNDVIYTFNIENTGNGPIDTDSLFLVDELPDEITFFNGDVDGPAGPETDTVSFSQSGTGLSFGLLFRRRVGQVAHRRLGGVDQILDALLARFDQRGPLLGQAFAGLPAAFQRGQHFQN